MSTSKLKTIAIIILLLVNLTFLVLIAGQRIDINKRERNVKANLENAAHKNGIEIVTEGLTMEADLTEYIIGRDTESETKMAEAVIGTCTREDQGGNIFSYSSEKGSARFRGNGEFEISVAREFAGEFQRGEAEKLAKTMGLEVELSEEKEINGKQTARFQILLDGKPVFGCYAVFTYQDGGLFSVSGKRPTGEPQYRTDNTVMTVPTAVMRFIENISSGGYVCSTIENISCGYMFFTSVSGERTLTPVWRFETDTGSYFLNGITGIMVT